MFKFESKKSLRDEIRVLEGNLLLKNKEIAKLKEKHQKLEVDLQLKIADNLKIVEKLEETKEKILKLTCDLESSNEALAQLKEENHRLKQSNSSYRNANEKFKAEIKELKAKLEESMSDKYLRIPVKPGRTPNTTKMGLKRSVTSRTPVRNYLKKEESEKEEQI